jgi:hypothetical protein
MSNVIVNKTTSDVVEIEFIESKAQTSCVLKDSLLDGSLGYNFSVVHLSVPLESTPMFPITSEFALFTIHRRNVGISQTTDLAPYQAALATYNTFVNVQSQAVGQTGALPDLAMDALANALGVAPPGQYIRAQWVGVITTHYRAALLAAQLPTTISILGRNSIYYVSPNKPFFNAGELVHDLSNWCNIFNVEQTIAGITQQHYGGADVLAIADVIVNGQVAQTIAEQVAALRAGQERPQVFLEVKFTADASLELIGSTLFWNNFTIQCTNYMIAMFGLDKTQFQTVGGAKYLQQTNDSSQNAFTNPNANHVILAGGNLVAHTVRTVVPIYQSAEQRVKVSVQSDLSYNSNVKIENETEGRDRDICSGFFTNQITSKIRFDENRNLSGITIASTIYNGQFAFIRKTDRQHKWNRLMSSFDVRLLRFYLRVMYRDFNEIQNKYILSTKDVKIPENAFWQMVVRFVSNV